MGTKNILENSTFDKNNIPIVFNAKVISNEDRTGSGTIQVRIDNIDSNILDEDLAPCYPMLPIYLNIVPKVGERVRVLFYNLVKGDEKSFQSNRLYFPVISQYQNINFDPYHYTADSHETDGFLQPLPNSNNNTESVGVYPNKETIGLIGRDNNDILLKDKEVLLRAGKHVIDNDLVFNTIDPAFIQLKYGLKDLTTTFETIKETVQVIDDPDTKFTITTSGDTYNILVSNYVNDNQINTFSTNDLNELKNQIRIFQTIYPKYFIDTQLIELSSFPSYFENRQRTITRDVRKEVNEITNSEGGSVINVVASKINLITHNATKGFDVTNQVRYITDAEQIEINSDAHPLIYGDVLLEFLELVQNFVANHVHPYATVKPNQGVTEQQITSFPLDTLISKNIKID